MSEKRDQRQTPVVFISSTVEDLEEYRGRARDAALKLKSRPEMSENWPAAGAFSLEACQKRVAQADVVVVIVAHRYGWVPEIPGNTEKRSVTWLECIQAEKRGKEILAFLVDPKAQWPAERKEEQRLAQAAVEGGLDQRLIREVTQNLRLLPEFKKWLSLRVRAKFKTPSDLYGEVIAALTDWLREHPEFGIEPERGDPARYLNKLYSETSHIDIRGLQVGSGKAMRFPIEDLYIPLRSTVSMRQKKGKGAGSGIKEQVSLDRALRERCLVILGDPGAGKTTFLWRAAHFMCRAVLDTDKEALARLGQKTALFPVYLRLPDLHRHREACIGREGAPTTLHQERWLPHYLAAQDHDGKQGLEEKFFGDRLEEGAFVLLDGLDEAPSEADRKSLRRWIERAAGHWKASRFVITSRPASYKDEAVLDGFEQASIADLEDRAIGTFLTHWSRALFPTDEDQSKRHRAELGKAMSGRPEIRRMARNPVMLTALAVVHWNEKRLPEQRADLYESILRWLARSRESKKGRPSAERALALLQNLALAMHDHARGRQVQVRRHWAASILGNRFREVPKEDRIEAAEGFLRQEESDSGIVVGRGEHDLRFWHLTFQEYLTARALAARTEAEQGEVLLRHLYETEWRESVLLFAGVLMAQGEEKVDALFSAVLDNLGHQPGLPAAARCAGLLGSVVRDLSPLNYRAKDPRYDKTLDQALGIFDARRSRGLPIETAIQAAEAWGQAGDPRFAGDCGGNWAEIPPGAFWMGSQKSNPKGRNYDPEAAGDESPVHAVTLDAYRIGRYPVTVGEYAGFVAEEGYRSERYWKAGGFGRWDAPKEWEQQLRHPTRPAVGLSWFEAAAYAQWAGGRLPTEAEWERAARGQEGRIFPWGASPPAKDRLNFDDNVGAPTPVGVYPRGASPEGICDLAGNVLEWCQDWFGRCPDRDQTNPAGPPSGGSRSLRGGAWNVSAWYCRSSYRLRYQPVYRLFNIGFRMVFLGSQDSGHP